MGAGLKYISTWNANFKKKNLNGKRRKLHFSQQDHIFKISGSELKVYLFTELYFSNTPVSCRIIYKNNIILNH